jgi:hypothetical protein
MIPDMFEGFDPQEVARASRQFVADKRQAEKARATKSANRHHMRRATSEAHLSELLPTTFTDGESWHVMSRGDIDSLSYLRHILNGVSHLDHVLMSTWCIAKNDLTEISAWLEAGRIEQFDLYAGEIFPGSYGDEYEQFTKMCDVYGCRLVVAKNHSKITLCSNADTKLVVESSANVNTNPRIEQSTIHHNAALHAFYLEFFNGIKSIDKASKTH